MKWRTDIETAPKGVVATEERLISGQLRKVEVYVSVPVILATKCGRVVKSRWLPPDAGFRRPVGRWEGFQPYEDPVAWMPWPAHPEAN